jgi:multidrug efflux system membrane fusion protein
MQVELVGLGTVTPTATITVQTQISGQLLSVDYKEGQIVHKGERLAQIDPRPYEVTLAQAQGALVHDSGLLAQAQSDLSRYLILDKQDSIAKQTVADQEFLVKQDQGTVMEDKATIASSKLNLLYCRITAPVTGRVGLRLVDPGNYVQTSNSTGLVVVTALQPITVVFVLPESDVGPVMDAERSGSGLTVDALDRTSSKVIASGRLLAVDNTVDTTTGTIKLRASFPNQDLKLFPNEFVNARLQLKTLKNVVQVPVRALQYGAPGAFVYVVGPDDTVSVRVVKTGVTEGEETEVTSGIKAGETVVVDGVDLLKPGAKVKITEGRAGGGPTNNGPGAPPGEQPQNAPPANQGQSAGSVP